MRSVLLTGASTGIGRATALRLDAAGWRVFAGVRREEDAAGLKAAGSERMTPLFLDIVESEQIAAAAQRIETEVDGGLDGLVNNAGIAVPGPLETLPIEDFRRQLEVNLTGHVAMTQAMLPAIRRAGGRIVFVSSVGGRIAFPLTGAYHAAKFGVEAVGDVFRQELRPWGISVSIVEPGSIDTPIWQRIDDGGDEIGDRGHAEQEALYGGAIASYRKVVKKLAERGIPPDKVAVAIERALSSRRPRSRYLVGFDVKLQTRAKLLLPTAIFDRIVARQMNL
ncbi:MAG TPA: SDR family NAD(P)-dependent oxidoreductase [Solirubrobacterales bacterium]